MYSLPNTAVADVRGKSDAETIAAMLAVTDFPFPG